MKAVALLVLFLPITLLNFHMVPPTKYIMGIFHVCNSDANQPRRESEDFAFFRHHLDFPIPPRLDPVSGINQPGTGFLFSVESGHRAVQRLRPDIGSTPEIFPHPAAQQSRHPYGFAGF
jgi:hypothetical protein